jgi:hypothetical protein
MKTKITSFFGIFLVLLLVIGCKKDQSNLRVPLTVENKMVKELRTFFENKIEVFKKDLKDSAYQPSIGDIRWDDTYKLSSDNMYLIPTYVNASKKSKNFQVQKYILISGSLNDRKVSIVQAIIDLSKAESSFTKLDIINILDEKLSFNNEVSSDYFFISIIDLNHIFHFDALNAESKFYRNGKYFNYKFKKGNLQATNLLDLTTINNRQPLPSCTENGGTIMEIEWWYQFYYNGVLIYEEYMYSTYECIGGLGSGGGSNPPPGSSCVTVQTNFANMGNSVSQLISETVEEQLFSKIKKFEWKIYSAYTWGILSYETVEFERATTNSVWLYKKYYTRGDASVGAVIGGTRSYNIISKTADDKGSSALITIDFIVTHNIICSNPVLPPMMTPHQSQVLVRGGSPQIIYHD